MWKVDEAAKVQFTLLGEAHRWRIEVGDAPNTMIVLDVIDVPSKDGRVSEADFDSACAEWMQSQNEVRLTILREDARARWRHQNVGYEPVGHEEATDFGRDAEEQLNEIAQITGRDDVFLRAEPSAAVGVPVWYVFGPWLASLAGERFFRKPRLDLAIEFIGLAHRKAVSNPDRARQHRQMRAHELPEGARWVADRAAKRQHKHLKRVVDVASIGNGGHAVTWVDDQGCFHVEEDCNNVDIFRS